MAGEFNLKQARPKLKHALEAANYELLPRNADEPNLLQAQRITIESRTLIIDNGGQLRFTCVRPVKPEQSEIRKLEQNLTFNITRETHETLTVSYQFGEGDVSHFAKLLAELDQL